MFGSMAMQKSPKSSGSKAGAGSASARAGSKRSIARNRAVSFFIGISSFVLWLAGAHSTASR